MKAKYKSILAIVIILIFVVIGYYAYRNYILSSPYILELKNENKYLLFYGSIHSNDKNDQMFKDIEERFIKINPQIVLVEGDSNQSEYKDIEDAIINGESPNKYIAFRRVYVGMESVLESVNNFV